MAVNDTDKLDLLLIVGGEELRKLLQTLPEQPTAHIKVVDQHWQNAESKRFIAISPLHWAMQSSS